MITLIIIALIQFYICIATYRNWFYNEITYCKITESSSFIAMIFCLPVFVWIPILPIVVMGIATGYKYITLKWKVINK